MVSKAILGKKITLRLDYEIVDRLQDFANRERVPMSYVLRHLILRFLEGGKLTDEKRALPARTGTPSPARVERLQDEFRDEACAIFDDLRKQGYDMKEASKRTNFALKAKNHPWATYEVVTSVLRGAGRFRKLKGCP